MEKLETVGRSAEHVSASRQD